MAKTTPMWDRRNLEGGNVIPRFGSPGSIMNRVGKNAVNDNEATVISKLESWPAWAPSDSLSYP
ncbi:hypothetical protein CC78DRAFT_581217 [Lojkania enalia]|uniref:Uncharacterized protein n=1 Tax=Lojkania enalia TaxID=147567 RepID=A0A9P4K6C0_9PLEO|nr:hypothetical protein CC78DRAFT_581217 [Didymosphaeria enalia]